MRYVFSRKILPVEAQYSLQSILTATKEGLNRTVYESFPLPQDLYIPNGAPDALLTISEHALHLIAGWYIRGTAIHFQETYIRKPVTIQVKHPQTLWAYDMVDSLPASYIKAGHTTPDKAYAYGKKLIEAVNKANQISFDKLEAAYTMIARQCMEPGRYMRVYSPSEKTLYEARAELEAAHAINCIFDTSSATDADRNCPLTDIELAFFAKVFDIKMPEWYLRATNLRFDGTTKEGKRYAKIAVMPFVDSTDFAPSLQFTDGQSRFVYDSKTGQCIGKKTVVQKTAKTYDGNDQEAQVIPASYARDAQPQRLQNPAAERIRLAQQIMFFLSLPVEEQREFMTGSFDYCTRCGTYFELRDGCECGKHPALTDDEYLKYMATRRAPTEYVDIREVRYAF